MVDRHRAEPAGPPSGAPYESEQQNAFSIETVVDDDCCRLVLHGELDLASGPGLEAALRDVHAQGVKQLTVDLSDLQFMDSTGLGILIREQEAATPNGRRFSLGGTTPRIIHRLFEVAGVLDRFNFC